MSSLFPGPQAQSPTGRPTIRPRLRSRLAAGTAMSLIATVVGQGFALLTSIIYARLLGPRNLGVLAIYTQIAAIAVSIAGIELGIPITRFVANLRTKGSANLERFLGTVLTVVILSSAVSSVILVALGEAIGLGVYGSPILATMIRIATGFLVLNVLSAVAVAILQGLQQVRLMSIIGILIEALTFPVMFISLSVLGLIGAAVGGVVVAGAGAVILFGSARKHLKREGVQMRLSFDRESARGLFRFTLPLLGSIVLLKVAWLYQSSFLALNLGYDDTGLFRVASTVSRSIAFVSGAMSIPLLPALSEMYATASKSRTRENLTTLLRLTALVGFPLAAAVGLGSRIVVEALFGTGYAGASVVAFVLVVAAFLEAVNGVAANALLGGGRTSTLLMVDALQAFIIVAGTLMFVGSFGLIGAAYVSLLASIVYGVVVLGLLQKKRVIDLKRVSVPLLLAFAGLSVAAGSLSWGVQSNLPMIVIAVLVATAMSWAFMSSLERTLLRGAIGDLWRRQPA